jgi:hypothetical protein
MPCVILRAGAALVLVSMFAQSCQPAQLGKCKVAKTRELRDVSGMKTKLTYGIST